MTRAFTDIQDWYILAAAAIALLIYIAHGILQLIDHIRNKKAKIIQQADEEADKIHNKALVMAKLAQYRAK